MKLIEKRSLVSVEEKDRIKQAVKSVTEYQAGDYSGPRFLICGSRDWNEPQVINDAVLGLPKNAIVIQGGARGADVTAGLAAINAGLHMVEVMADWDYFGKRAGYLRNLAMLDLLRPGDVVIAFQVNDSVGTQHTIGEAERRGFEVRVVDVDGEVDTTEADPDDRCPACLEKKLGDIPKCTRCGFLYKPELFTYGVEVGSGVNDYDIVGLGEAQQAEIQGHCRFCGADLEKQTGEYCECGHALPMAERDGKRGADDHFARTCEECGAEVVKGRCECGLYAGVVQEAEEPKEERVQYLGNMLYLNEHAKDCRCETCRIVRQRRWIKSDAYRRLYKTGANATCSCSICRKKRFWERVFSGVYRREYKPVFRREGGHAAL